MLPEQQQRIMGYFIEEAKDHLNTIEQGLINLQATIEDPEMANEVFRAAHSVKGGAAMLGIESVQRTAHRMEDYFKVLKESPIRADRALESMFLQVFDALQELIVQMQGPFGLTDDKAEEIMTGVEPVFEQLHHHLDELVQTASIEKPAVASRSEPAVVQPPTASYVEDSALQLVFKSDVSGCLREMLALFKQDDTDRSRQSLQAVCQRLKQFGEQFELGTWNDLIESARLAVSDRTHDYRTLAPVLIKNIKKAQELVLANRAPEIEVSEAMQALLPEDVLATESDADTLDSLFDEADDEALTTVDLDAELEAAELDGAELENAELETAELEDTGFDDLFSADAGLGDLSQAAEAMEPSQPDSAPFDLELDNLELPADATLEATEETAFDALLGTSAEPAGPEVGDAELNSLADLFEGDLSDLDAAWQEEDLPASAIADPSEAVDINISSDFTDLLEGNEAAQEAATDDLTDLFGDLESTSATTDLAADLDMTSTTESEAAALNLDSLDLDLGMEELSEPDEASEAIDSELMNSEPVGEPADESLSAEASLDGLTADLDFGAAEPLDFDAALTEPSEAAFDTSDLDFSADAVDLDLSAFENSDSALEDMTAGIAADSESVNSEAAELDDSDFAIGQSEEPFDDLAFDELAADQAEEADLGTASSESLELEGWDLSEVEDAATDANSADANSEVEDFFGDLEAAEISASVESAAAGTDAENTIDSFFTTAEDSSAESDLFEQPDLAAAENPAEADRGLLGDLDLSRDPWDEDLTSDFDAIAGAESETAADDLALDTSDLTADDLGESSLEDELELTLDTPDLAADFEALSETETDALELDDLAFDASAPSAEQAVSDLDLTAGTASSELPDLTDAMFAEPAAAADDLSSADTSPELALDDLLETAGADTALGDLFEQLDQTDASP
ncbi:MAG: hypothetical protein F6J97_20040, partial [Leptolyngbya sp. SIO4C1]|nr:hypothetical protein [Leptolyngbya sp. SIO4C1]